MTAGERVISSTYVWQLRTGRRDNPTQKHLSALGAFFGVSPASALPLSYAPPRRAHAVGGGIAARVPVPPPWRHREDSLRRHVPASIPVLGRLT